MIHILVKIYRFFFAKTIFEKWNMLLYRLSLSGLGVLNSENSRVSGEEYFLKKYLHLTAPGGVIIDVGANAGEYSLTCAELRPDANVFAFEPHPKTFQVLLGSLSGANAHCYNKAVGRAAGTLELFDYDDQDGSPHASVYKEVIEGIHKGNAVSHKVEVVSLDDFIKAQGLKDICLLKIDTEGHELEVLKGAAETIDLGSIGAIQFEFNEMNVISRCFLSDFVDILADYDLYRLLPSGMIKIKYDSFHGEIFAYQNIVAINRNMRFPL